MSEYAIDDKVTCRFMPGSIGRISCVEESTSTLFGNRYKVAWETHEYMRPGEADESGWLSESELRPIAED